MSGKAGLGDFWCSLHPEADKAAQAFLDRFHEYRVVGPAETVADDHGGMDAVISMILKTPMVDAVAWIGVDREGQRFLASHYPTVLDGCGEVQATLISVECWARHIEGLVRVSVEGKEFVFFDDLFPNAREGYVPGESILIGLCGLSVSVRRMSEIAEVSSGKSKVSEIIGRIYETGETWFGHSPEIEYADDLHLVMGKLSKMENGYLGPLPLFRCEIELFPGVRVPVVFGPDSIGGEGWGPKTGDYVAMMVFLHGHRVALAPR